MTAAYRVLTLLMIVIQSRGLAPSSLCASLFFSGSKARPRTSYVHPSATSTHFTQHLTFQSSTRFGLPTVSVIRARSAAASMSTPSITDPLPEPTPGSTQPEPSTPAAESSIQHEPEHDEGEPVPAHTGFRLELAPFGLEPLAEYQPGGYHPVQLGDCLGDDGRYRALAKLGHGGFATVWLCRDTLEVVSTKYVSVKVLMADGSTDNYPELQVEKVKSALCDCKGGSDIASTISLPLDNFTLEGPNGKHFCFVSKVHGPKVNFASLSNPEAHGDILRNICRSIVRAVDLLHQHNLCHGGESTESHCT